MQKTARSLTKLIGVILAQLVQPARLRQSTHMTVLPRVSGFYYEFYQKNDALKEGRIMVDISNDKGTMPVTDLAWVYLNQAILKSLPSSIANKFYIQTPKRAKSKWTAVEMLAEWRKFYLDKPAFTKGSFTKRSIVKTPIVKQNLLIDLEKTVSKIIVKEKPQEKFDRVFLISFSGKFVTKDRELVETIRRIKETNKDIVLKIEEKVVC